MSSDDALLRTQPTIVTVDVPATIGEPATRDEPADTQTRELLPQGTQLTQGTQLPQGTQLTIGTVATPLAAMATLPSDAVRSQASTSRPTNEPADGAEYLLHYRITGELGRGGMGVVYAARDEKLDRKVAIKQLLAAGDEGLRRRMLREARAMAKLSHPNVIPVYEIGEFEGSTYIVMEYVEGATLRHWLTAEPRTQTEILGVFEAAARGLIAAHGKGLVHRDFKPDNVMVGDDGRVRVMDFGLARADDVRESDPDAANEAAADVVVDQLTRVGAVLGTPAYMPPEQLRGERAEAAADQFSFCVALYEALYGHRPFIANTLGQLREATERGQVREPPPSSRVPTWLRQLVVRGLEPRVEDRFESMQVMLDALVAAELAADARGREPPAYVFVAHVGDDKQLVRRLCGDLLEHGVRPWLDMWNLETEGDWRAALEQALRDAPAVLLCHGSQAWPAEHECAEVLRERIERDPSTVYRVGLPGAVSEGLPLSSDTAGVDLHEHSWDAGIVALARLIGVDGERIAWLEHEAKQAGVSASQLSPYRGLEAFRERDARWMFGRDDEIGELLDLIRAGETRFLTLVGASGSGKSSLVRAGVCPALRNGALAGDRNWEIAVMRPGTRPCESLARALLELRRGVQVSVDEPTPALASTEPDASGELMSTRTLPTMVNSDDVTAQRSAGTLTHQTLPVGELLEQTQDVIESQQWRLDDAPTSGSTPVRVGDDGPASAGLRSRLLADPDTLRELVEQISAGSTRILLVIDQLEELFTEARLGESAHGDEHEAAALLHNLIEAAESCPQLWILATVRADFVQRCLEIGPLARALRGGTYFALPPMGEAQIRAAITRPARRVGYEVEPKLVEQLVAATAEHVGRLPLLQHVLRELWHRRDGERRLLTHAAYVQAGGLEGAIAVAAEQALATLEQQLGERARLVTRRAMSRLVHLGKGTSGDTGRRARIDELGDDDETRKVLAAFVGQARVLIADEQAGVEVFELAHEALLREWTTLTDWLDADREALRLRQELGKDAERRGARTDNEFLWGRARVEEAQRVLASSVVELNAAEQGFLDASARAVRTRTRRVQAGVASFMVAALGVTLVVLNKNQQISAQKAEVEVKNSELDQKNVELEDEQRKQKAAASQQRGLRAQMLIPLDREAEALRLAIEAVGVYGPGWTEQPPADAIAGLEQVLANDALVLDEQLVVKAHRKPITTLSISPDGTRVATSSQDNTAAIWDSQTGARLLTLEGHANFVYEVEFSPDGSKLVTASKDGTAKLWRASDAELLADLVGHQKPVMAVEWSGSGTRVATASADGTAKLWGADGELLASLDGHQKLVSAVVWSPDETTIATSSWDGSARIWDAASGSVREVLDNHEGEVHALAWSPDGRLLATGDDLKARVWDGSTGERVAVLQGHADEVVALAWSRDAGHLATGSDDATARIWDVRAGKQLAVLRGHENAIFTLAYAADGMQLATGSLDGSVRLWDPESGRQRAALFGHTDAVSQLAYAPDGTWLVTVAGDGSLRRWDPQIDNPIATEHGHRDFIYDLAFSPDGTRLATAGRDNIGRVWDASTGKQITTLVGHENALVTVAWSLDGTRIATGAHDDTLRLWRADTGEQLAVLAGHTHRIRVLAWSPDGGKLASASLDKTVRVWSADTHEALLVLEGHEDRIRALAWSPDGSKLASASRDGSVRVWSLATGEQLLSATHGQSVELVTFSPDGAHIATASDDGSLRIWAARDLRLERTLVGHEDVVTDMQYSPDGALLVSSSSDETARVWDASSGELLALLVGHERPLTAARFLANAQRVVTGAVDGEVRIWNARGGECVVVLEGHTGAIEAIALAPDGSRFATASEDHRAKTWDGETGELLVEFRDRIGLRHSSGAIEWPVSAQALLGLACRRLSPFKAEYEQVRVVCESP